MNIEEAIKTAIQYETGVRDVYRDAMRSAGDDTAKKIYRALAREEQGHLDYLLEKQAELKTTGKVSAGVLKTVVPEPEKIARGLDELKTKVGGERVRAKPVDADMLGKALKVEEETSAFYKRMVDELPEEGQAFFQRFVEIEEGHVAIVRAELDAVQGTGYWYDFLEIDMEVA